MTPIHCLVRHDPPRSYGDCLRACIASVMDMRADQVPHFYRDNPEPRVALDRARDFLRPHGETIFAVEYPPVGMSELFDMMHMDNPDCVYLLFGVTSSGGGHVVVCRAGRVIHNPAWTGSALIGPNQHGWGVWVVART